MIGVETLPIYELFKGTSTDEQEAYKYLKGLIDTYLKVDEKMYGIIKDKDVQ